MKTASFIFVLVCSFVATAQTPKQNQILFDFRQDKRGADVKIPAATERAVLAKLFRRYLADPSKCNPNFEPGGATDYLKAARNAGQVAPTIVDRATGSFTAAGQTQIAYVISVNECGSSHADNYGSKRMAIFSGDKLVADVDLNFRSTILRKSDLNNDGIDELLLMASDMNQGIVIEVAELVHFKDGRRNVIDEFGQTLEDSCGSEAPGSEGRAAVVSYSGGGLGEMPKFRVDHYRTSCARIKQWRFKSTGKIS